MLEVNINYEYCKDGGKVNPMADEANIRIRTSKIF
jgi:hypothetical protein